MMKNFIIVVLALSPLFAGAQQLTLSARINGLEEGAKVQLNATENGDREIAMARVQNGAFTISTKSLEPAVYNLKLGAQSVPMFLSEGSVQVSGSLDKTGNFVVTGAPLHEQFIRFQNSVSPYMISIQGLEKQAQESGVTDALRSRYLEMMQQAQQKIASFIDENPGSPVSAWVILATQSLTPEPEVFLKRVSILQPSAMKSAYGKQLREKVAELSVGAVGSMAMDFTQNDESGKPVSLSSFKGKYVLVDFWASWCGPCRRENPNVVSAFEKYKKKNFTILGVSFDQSKDKWLKAVADDRLAWTQVSDLGGWGNAVGKLYRISSIPQNLLIDPTGKIIAKNLRGEELNQRLAELLK